MESPGDDPLVAIYDETTLRAIEGSSAAVDQTERNQTERNQEERARLSGLQRAATTAAVLQATALGVAEVLEPDEEQAFTDVDDEFANWRVSGGPDSPVTLIFVPNNPYATRAIVRPWLFPPDTGAASS